MFQTTNQYMIAQWGLNSQIPTDINGIIGGTILSVDGRGGPTFFGVPSSNTWKGIETHNMIIQNMSVFRL